jgi:hypothetical protein
MTTRGRHTIRGTIAKVLIALAVLAPAGLLLSVFVSRNFGHYIVWNRSLVQTMFIASAALLALGLLLHRGEDL